MSIKVQQVSRLFNGEPAVQHVSFKAEKGEIVGLLGTSGCGKSTLLRAISGLDTGYDGTIEINGHINRGTSKDLGLIFQEPRLMPWLTVLENVCFGLEGKAKANKKKAKELLQVVGLEGFEHYYPKQLSGGMAQRTAIARALVTEPDTLLLDEPFSALDAFTKLQLQDMLLDLWQSYQPTMVIVTHDIDEALTLCDRVIILKGQPGELYKNIEVKQPKPRSKGDAGLAKLKEDIIDSLEVTKKVAPTSQKHIREA
ncbi:ABC transporter ATP-binding protein [Salipaludibacillus agaradhaerens]|uniref:ABC transporter ATP-binding protein n=1 Tax=Salipaludibacillus agaradhaerens TaxID=76935 RepID=A0A9Q4AYF9_SALAG|nr:ABC transporter ATP-binding protein [Salipaludibacillus agaradhaerens]MCR6095197.1 ABC transporter ATP-binding protein [Salipaludibacillus agaradhaerens]MCR6115245.1 ABC transporter ATP-binding protein [Salipaludibacillus agaradhaerens]